MEQITAHKHKNRAFGETSIKFGTVTKNGTKFDFKLRGTWKSNMAAIFQDGRHDDVNELEYHS